MFSRRDFSARPVRLFDERCTGVARLGETAELLWSMQVYAERAAGREYVLKEKADEGYNICGQKCFKAMYIV